MVQDRRGGEPLARFFVAPEELNGPQILLTGENAQHARVLRLKAGEEVLACDGQGMECLCTVESVSAGEVILEVLERRSSRNEAAVKVSIYMAFPKADKLEHVIQKATELGAYEIPRRMKIYSAQLGYPLEIKPLIYYFY